MYSIEYSRNFLKQAKRCKKRGYNMQLLEDTLDLLVKNGKLPAKYKAHKLSGNYTGCWECHIKPDWLLVWKQDNDKFVLLLTGTGTHSDLFK